jgi:hypothetical protein
MSIAAHRLALFFIMMLVMAGTVHAQSRENLREQAARWLIERVDWIPCDEDHFIYGVGYIDGSYMERIFYVQGSGPRPLFNIRFREEAGAQRQASDDEGRQEFRPVPFVMELQSPTVLYAEPRGERWAVSNEGWQSGLRFKYTSWFGTVQQREGAWDVTWKGYRQPMLPEGLRADAEKACALFAGR